jgi:hypothetical protein
MHRLSLARLCALAFAGAALTACDRNGASLEIVPEFDDVYSFEAGMENWNPRPLDLGSPPSTWEIVRSNASAAAGNQSVQLRLDNTSGQGKIWIERRYQVPPDQEYEVTLLFALGSADHSAVPAWRVLAGVARDQPAVAADLTTSSDTWNGSAAGVGQEWNEKTVIVQTKSDAEGEIFIYVGIGGTSSGLRTYYVDNVRATFMRKGISAPPGPT